MIGHFHRAMRLVLPPPTYCVLAIVLSVSFQGYAQVLLRDAHPGAFNIQQAAHFQVFGGVAIFLSALLYGHYRCRAKHPWYGDDYRAWLATTPWSVAKPLPLGPLRLVWQDGMVIGLLMACLLDSSVSRLYVVYAFALGYGLPMALSLVALGAAWRGYAAFFLLAVATGLLANPLPQFVAVMLALACVQSGARPMLAEFPWPTRDETGRFYWEMLWLLSRYFNSGEGWPHALLSPPASGNFKVPRRDAVMIGLLAGAWAFAVFWLARGGRDQLPFGAVFYVWLVAFIARFARYKSNHAAPISLLGRLATGKWIIPAHDVVYAPLILMTVIAWWIMGLVSFRLDSHSLSFIVLESIGVVAVSLIALLMGPSYEKWALTGDHRIVMTDLGNNARELKKI